MSLEPVPAGRWRRNAVDRPISVRRPVGRRGQVVCMRPMNRIDHWRTENNRIIRRFSSMQPADYFEIPFIAVCDSG
ncbi:hypothetical protein AQ610_19995 [Burkholderia humptydooensis]|nr:hypothetical protein AQ610_19995 [Burkholderia humptydooensis]